MENSSQDVSPFEAVEARVGVIKVEWGFMMSETIADGTGDEMSSNCKVKWVVVSSCVVTEEGGDGGGAGTSVGLSDGTDERRISG